MDENQNRDLFGEASENDDGDLQTVPSCIDSLANSSEQLRQLALKVHQTHLKQLMCFANIHQDRRLIDEASQTIDRLFESSDNSTRHKTEVLKALEDQGVLECLRFTLKIITYLNDLNSFIERCLATVELTLKRSVYHLHQSASRSPSRSGELDLQPSANLNPVFVALMDLFFALESLDSVLRKHGTDLDKSLMLFRNVCRLINKLEHPPEHLDLIPADQIGKLFRHICNLQQTLSNKDKGLFKQLIEHIENLDLILRADKTHKGFVSLQSQLENFLVFLANNMIDSESQVELVTGNIQPKSSPLQTSILICSNLIPRVYMTSSSRRLFGMVALLTFYTKLFKRCDKRLLRAVMICLVRVKHMNMIKLDGSNSFVFVHDFLFQNLPKDLLDFKVLNQLKAHSDSLLKLNLDQELEQFTQRVMPTLMQLRSNLYCKKQLSGRPNLKLITIISHSTNLISEISNTIQDSINIYSHHGKPIQRNSLIALFRMIALLKSLQAIIYDNRIYLDQCLFSNERKAQIMWMEFMLDLQKRFLSLPYSQRKLSEASTLALISICSSVDLFDSTLGRSVVAFCLPMLLPLINQRIELQKLNGLLLCLEQNSSIWSTLRYESNCAFLFWNLTTLDIYYTHVFSQGPGSIDELGYFLLALDDILSLFQPVEDSDQASVNLEWLEVERQNFLDRLTDDLIDQIKSDLFDKICQELEIELRIQTHGDLNANSGDSVRRHLYDFKQIFSKFAAYGGGNLLRILNKVYLLNEYVEHHLNKVAYNLTSIAPQDCHIYDEMMNIAEKRFSLKLINLQLPARTAGHDLELLDVMRNLDRFISRYSYDIIHQIFIEKSHNRNSLSSSFSQVSLTNLSSSGSHTTQGQSYALQSLNVFQINHVVSSIQTHGFGLINSSVNHAYQIMKRLINLISKQMADEKLITLLAREQRHFHMGDKALSSPEERSKATSRNLDYERISRLAKKLSAIGTGSTSTPSVDLDSMRQSVTQLGNLLAFVRMLKNGALSCASKSIDFLPDINDLSLLRLNQLANSELSSLEMGEQEGEEGQTSCDGIKRAVLEASKNFDNYLQDLDENFSQRRDYFKVIVDLFADLLKSPRREHGSSSTTLGQDKRVGFELFYFLVPALTINYIDFIIICKERVHSRSANSRLGALLCDDGFALGVAFLLTVLKQVDSLVEMHWSEQVKMKIHQDIEEIEKRLANPQLEESLKQTAVMSMKRLKKLEIEYDILKHTLDGALLLFRDTKTDSLD